MTLPLARRIRRDGDERQRVSVIRFNTTWDNYPDTDQPCIERATGNGWFRVHWGISWDGLWSDFKRAHQAMFWNIP